MMHPINMQEVEAWNSGIDKQALIDRCKHFVLDMDGTFYLGDEIIEGSLDFIAQVQKTGRDFLFFTNNSSKNADDYRKKLAAMHCPITDRQIMTSGDVTIAYISTHYAGKSVYVVGTQALIRSFTQAGIRITDDQPDIVVLGFDQSLTYEKITKSCTFIRQGAVYLATHPDINCPVKGGFIPDVGSFIAMIALSTGRNPDLILGKPNGTTVDMIMQRTGWHRQHIAFIGDRLYTDVATGVNNGAYGLLVLSGESDMRTVHESPVKADAVFIDLKEISTYLRS